MNKLIAKIKALLRLATSPNEHEAASAAEKAATMLAEHNLELADLKQESQTVIDFDPELLMVPEPWRRLIGKSLGQLYFAHYLYSPLTRDHVTWDAHGFVGAEHNIKVAKLMFVYVVKAIVMRAQEAALRRGQDPDRDRIAYYGSFCMAAAMRVNARIQKRLAEAAAGYLSPNAGTTLPALVSLYERTARELTLFVEKELGDGAASEEQAVETNDLRGVLDGTAAGDQIGLDTQITTKDPVAKLTS